MREVWLQGASIGGVGLQASNLRGAKLQGTKVWTDHLTSENQQGRELGPDHQLFSRVSVPTFAERIRETIGKESDLSEIRFEGGLSEEDIDSLVEDLIDENAEVLRTKLASHIGRPPSYELPGNSGAITEAYTGEEAEKWIAEYEKAMAERPGDDS